MTTASTRWLSPQGRQDLVLPEKTQVRAAELERHLQKLAGQTVLSTPRLYALMCIADRDEANAAHPSLSGLEWSYNGWSPVPARADPSATILDTGLRERRRLHRAVRSAWRKFGHLPIDDLVVVASQAFDELRLAKRRNQHP
jgi:hypothetical protein